MNVEYVYISEVKITDLVLYKKKYREVLAIGNHHLLLRGKRDGMFSGPQVFHLADWWGVSPKVQVARYPTEISQ